MKLKESVDLKVLEELGFKKVSPQKYVRVYQDLMVIKIIKRKVISSPLTHLSNYMETYNLSIKDLIEKGLVE